METNRPLSAMAAPQLVGLRAPRRDCDAKLPGEKQVVPHRKLASLGASIFRRRGGPHRRRVHSLGCLPGLHSGVTVPSSGLRRPP